MQWRYLANRKLISFNFFNLINLFLIHLQTITAHYNYQHYFFNKLSRIEKFFCEKNSPQKWRISLGHGFRKQKEFSFQSKTSRDKLS